MKDFKLRFIYAICVVVVCALYLLGERSGLTERKQTHFTVTADTNVSKVPGLSKYVTQEEVDSFAFRYWDIDDEREYTNSHWEENATLKKLRLMLKAKDTRGVLNFLKDNNLSVNLQMYAGTSPLIYSAFYDDENTAKELIKLGADIEHQDKYKLNPLAYAIANNSLKTFKTLINNGADVKKLAIIQDYLNTKPNIIASSYIKSIAIDESGDENITYKTQEEIINDANMGHGYRVMGGDVFTILMLNNQIEMLQILFDKGFRPLTYMISIEDSRNGQITTDNISDSLISNYDKEKYIKDPEEFKKKLSLYVNFNIMKDYDEMLDLFLRYNIPGQPSEAIRKRAFEDCQLNYLKTLSILDYDRLPTDSYTTYRINSELKFYEKFCGDESENAKELVEARFYDRNKWEELYKTKMKDRNFTVREYINYTNTKEKLWEIYKFARDNPDAIFLVDKNITYRRYMLDNKK
nr:ankyrin repeat domain-containing protein [uncultured Campylobacter sp.]